MAKFRRRPSVNGDDTEDTAMKVWIPPHGETPAHPDFGALKAALIAAQAATPTARASAHPTDTPLDVHAALHALFADRSGKARSADALGHRFGPTSPSAEGDDEER